MRFVEGGRPGECVDEGETELMWVHVPAGGGQGSFLGELVHWLGVLLVMCHLMVSRCGFNLRFPDGQ